MPSTTEARFRSQYTIGDVADLLGDTEAQVRGLRRLGVLTPVNTIGPMTFGLTDVIRAALMRQAQALIGTDNPLAVSIAMALTPEQALRLLDMDPATASLTADTRGGLLVVAFDQTWAAFRERLDRLAF